MAAFKLILLGEIAVGKTSLVRRLTLGRFETNYLATVGVDIYQYEIPEQHASDVQTPLAEPTKLIIWDIEGDMAESILQHYYATGADAALIVCDASRPETERTAEALAAEFVQRFPGRPFAQAVNKTDLAPDAEKKSYANLALHAETVFLTSAKSGAGVEEAFLSLGNTLCRRRDGRNS